ncbi:MAG: hypothetical protein J5674_05740 [Candidatus Methanomethylophilaceae archaeon]|nr:hypothetical protein [Candidatus Methanomethylophilaceae archaeon]
MDAPLTLTCFIIFSQKNLPARLFTSATRKGLRDSLSTTPEMEESGSRPPSNTGTVLLKCPSDRVTLSSANLAKTAGMSMLSHPIKDIRTCRGWSRHPSRRR